MYLKRIIANGFKSFADKVNIELDNGITGIVGPNGSGKSNVVDAVRWVLGEQSVKSLRGDGNMTEVIFSGSKSRKATNTASVTLVFDNKDKYLPLDFDEISITRRVYRDATNEYFINNEQVRLKDITELLLDSGIAKESFNIISQGKVEEIINSKPENRRTIFEEAASVLKYRKRKEEALRKLDRTHTNMNRVNDIISELKNQVEPLKQQRDKAIIYKQKSAELENVEVALITKDITDINYNYVENKKRIESLNEELLSLSLDNNKAEAKIEEYKLKLTELDKEINSLNKDLLEKTTLVEILSSVFIGVLTVIVFNIILINEDVSFKIFTIFYGIAAFLISFPSITFTRKMLAFSDRLTTGNKILFYALEMPVFIFLIFVGIFYCFGFIAEALNVGLGGAILGLGIVAFLIMCVIIPYVQALFILFTRLFKK